MGRHLSKQECKSCFPTGAVGPFFVLCIILPFSSFGCKAGLETVAFNGAEITVYDAQTDKPLGKARVDVTWVACRDLFFDCNTTDRMRAFSE
jgi:hypothetical protein